MTWVQGWRYLRRAKTVCGVFGYAVWGSSLMRRGVELKLFGFRPERGISPES